MTQYTYTPHQLRRIAAAIIKRAQYTPADMFEVEECGLTIFVYLNAGRVLVADILADDEPNTPELIQTLRAWVERLYYLSG